MYLVFGQTTTEIREGGKDNMHKLKIENGSQFRRESQKISSEVGLEDDIYKLIYGWNDLILEELMVGPGVSGRAVARSHAGANLVVLRESRLLGFCEVAGQLWTDVDLSGVEVLGFHLRGGVDVVVSVWLRGVRQRLLVGRAHKRSLTDSSLHGGLNGNSEDSEVDIVEVQLGLKMDGHAV